MVRCGRVRIGFGNWIERIETIAEKVTQRQNADEHRGDAKEGESEKVSDEDMGSCLKSGQVMGLDINLIVLCEVFLRFRS